MDLPELDPIDGAVDKHFLGRLLRTANPIA